MLILLDMIKTNLKEGQLPNHNPLCTNSCRFHLSSEQVIRVGTRKADDIIATGPDEKVGVSGVSPGAGLIACAPERPRPEAHRQQPALRSDVRKSGLGKDSKDEQFPTIKFKNPSSLSQGSTGLPVFGRFSMESREP